MASIGKVSESMAQLNVQSSDAELKNVLSEICGDRQIPSRIAQIIQRMVDVKDSRIINALQGNFGIERTLQHPAPTTWQEAVLVHAIRELQPWIDSLYQGVDLRSAKKLTKEEEKELKLSRINLVYGEVNFTSLAKIVATNCNLPPGGAFYDVGSGAGRGVFSAAFMHQFDRCTGIEIVSGLSRVSQQQLQKFNQHILPGLEKQAAERGEEFKLPDITFICSDFRDVPWTDASLVWANSTCFDTTLMEYLSRKSEEMKIGTYFISLTKRLQSSHWELCCPSELHTMSWGCATVHCHVKVKPARDPNANDDDGADEADEADQS